MSHPFLPGKLQTTVRNHGDDLVDSEGINGVRRARCPSERSPAQPQGMSSVLPLPQQTGLADQDGYPIFSRNNSGTGPWTGSSQLPAPLPQPSMHRAAPPLSQASVQPPCPSQQPHAGGLSSPHLRPAPHQGHLPLTSLRATGGPQHCLLPGLVPSAELQSRAQTSWP